MSSICLLPTGESSAIFYLSLSYFHRISMDAPEFSHSRIWGCFLFGAAVIRRCAAWTRLPPQVPLWEEGSLFLEDSPVPDLGPWAKCMARFQPSLALPLHLMPLAGILAGCCHTAMVLQAPPWRLNEDFTDTDIVLPRAHLPGYQSVFHCWAETWE